MRGTRGFWDYIVSTYGKYTTTSSLLIVALFVLLANFAYISITNPDPVLSRSGLPVQNGGAYIELPFAGGNSIEGNDGITKQALGVQAAHQILSGKLPLWNHYEGIGSPLLGETQSAALSPFTLLLLLPHGFLINELVLEIMAGIGMYLFIKYLGNIAKYKMGNAIAITGGCLYATLGTFMMLPNACFNPIAFLPWSMFGITLIYLGEKRVFARQNIVAMLVLTISVALSLLSGFPEIAFINMLLVLLYAVALFVKTPKDKKLTRLVSMTISGIVALLVVIPWLIEFFTYINPVNGTAGIHNEKILYGLSNSGSGYLSSFIPNAIGFAADNPVYGSIGGFFTISCVILALFAICSKDIKLWHKILFGGWFLVGWMRILGFRPVSTIMAHIPMLGSAAVYRYIPVSMSFSLILLACLGINSVARNKKVDRRVIASIACFILLFYGFILFSGRHYLKSFISTSVKDALFSMFFLQLSILASLAVLLAIAVRWKYKKQFICIVLVLESTLCFVVWQFGAYSRTTAVDMSSAHFLQRNLEAQRFDSDLINPNYGSYFSIAELSMMDLPIPTLWSNYINKNIDAYIPSIGYLSNDFSAKRIDQDERLGVKYLLVRKGTLASDVIKQRHLSLVYSDDKSEVFELPGYRQYIFGDGCSVIHRSNPDQFTVSCTRASRLTRLELFYPGWHARVDGKNVAIVKADNLFQQINVAKGAHVVEFYYWPKYMMASLALSGMGLLSIFGTGGFLSVSKAREVIGAKKK